MNEITLPFAYEFTSVWVLPIVFCLVGAAGAFVWGLFKSEDLKPSYFLPGMFAALCLGGVIVSGNAADRANAAQDEADRKQLSAAVTELVGAELAADDRVKVEKYLNTADEWWDDDYEVDALELSMGVLITDKDPDTDEVTILLEETK